MSVHHIHHVTAVTRDPHRNHDFYVNVLGLRLVKKTVNFDDPSAYHLYYADTVGAPGTVLTFFHWEKLLDAREGTRSIAAVFFAVPPMSLSAWRTRLSSCGVGYEESVFFGEPLLSLRDPDGLKICLVERAGVYGMARTDSSVPERVQISHIHGVEFCLQEMSKETEAIYGMFGYTDRTEDGSCIRLSLKGNNAHALYVTRIPSGTPARMGCGSIHHAAFRVSHDDAQEKVREALVAHSFDPTPVIDRFYFRSVYFFLPEGPLCEVATDTPGFLIDEDREALGTRLCLPPQYEEYRARIEDGLQPFDTYEHE